MNYPIVPSDGQFLLYCRSGFEQECAIEVETHAKKIGASGYARWETGHGFVIFVPHSIKDRELLNRLVSLRELVFARQLVLTTGSMLVLPAKDRITPLLEHIKSIGSCFSDVFLETADTNEAKKLSVFTRKFTTPFKQALTRSKLIGGSTLPRLHLFFSTSTETYVGYSMPHTSSPWLMGIPRLKLFRDAPSRAALKLEEAFLIFLDKPEELLRPGMTAVDLGAAPGGWTWELVKRHFRVIAVDNATLSPLLLTSGLVTHYRADGFHYRPNKTVNWLVCDIVEQPARIANLIGRWMISGWCHRAIFNLKLPMKKRYQEVEHCRHLILKHASDADVSITLAFKQLYHDRAEVTGYCALATSPRF